MFPDQIALLSVTAMAKKVGGSALPNAPVVDDSNDRPPLRVRLARLRLRLPVTSQPSERPAPASQYPATVPGC